MEQQTERSDILLAAGILAALYFGMFWRLLLTNLYISWPMEISPPLGNVLTVLLSLFSGGMFVLALAGVWRVSRVGFAVAMISTLSLAWMLYPVACDTRESFVDRPNRVCDCSGIMLDYYPQGTMDGAGIEYCIGLERDVT